jgi:WD40 repeat protein
VVGDWSVPAGPDWWQQVLNLIRSADVFILLATADSAASETVRAEIAKAEEFGKRIVTVVGSAGVSAESLHPAARRPNFLFAPAPRPDAGPPAEFVKQLAAAVHTNFAEIEEHTRLLLFAETWILEGRHPDRLLKGTTLDRADRFLGDLSAEPGEWRPRQTPNQREFVLSSRREQRRRRVVTTVAAVVTLSASVVAYRAYRNSVDTAANERLAGRLVSVARRSLLAQRPDRALLAAAGALHLMASSRDAEALLRQAVGMIPKPVRRICGNGGNSRPLASKNGHLLAVQCAPGRLSVFALPSLQLLQTIPNFPEVEQMALTPDDRSVVVRSRHKLLSYDIQTGRADSFEEFDALVPPPRSSRNFPTTDPTYEALSPSGRFAATFSDRTVHVLDLASKRIQHFRAPFDPFRVTISADEQFVGVNTRFVSKGKRGIAIFSIGSGREIGVPDDWADELSVGRSAEGRLSILLAQGNLGEVSSHRSFRLYQANKQDRFDAPREFSMQGFQRFPPEGIVSEDGRVLVWKRTQIDFIRPVVWTLQSPEDEGFDSVSIAGRVTVVISGGKCPDSNSGICSRAILQIFDGKTLRFRADLPGSGAEAVVIDGAARAVIGTSDGVWLTELADDSVTETISNEGQVAQVLLGEDWLASLDSLGNVVFRKGSALTRLQGTAISVDGGGNLLALAPTELGTITVHHVIEGRPNAIPFKTLPAGGRERIRGLALSPDNGRIAIAAADPLRNNASYLRVVDLYTDQELCRIQGALVERLVWSPKRNLLGLWELKQRTPAGSYTDADSRFVLSATPQGCGVFRRDWALINRAPAGFSADGRYAVLGGPNQNGGPSLLVDFDRLDDYLATNYYNNGNLNLEDVDRAAFSSNAGLVAISTLDGTVSILERRTKRTVQTIDGTGVVHAIRFTDDGRFLEIARGDGEVRRSRYFVLPADRLFEEACGRSVQKTVYIEEPALRVAVCPASRGDTGLYR